MYETETICIQLFDSTVCVQTNDEALYATISLGYRRLIQAKPVAGCRTYSLIQANGQAILTTPTARFTLTHWPASREDILDWILFEAFGNVQSHMAFHGAALVVDGKGVAIVADSMQGKTTLTLGLLQAGAQFMSDESAAIAVGTTNLQGMPRALSIRPLTAELLGLDLPNFSGNQASLFCDIDTIFTDRLAEVAPLRKIFILSNNLRTKSDGRLRLRLNRISAEFHTAITTLPSVKQAKVYPQNGFVDVLLTVSERHTTFTQIQELSKQHNILILNARTHEDTAPNFARAPVATPLGKAQAALEMLSHLQGGHQSDLIMKRFAGNEGHLFQSLIRSLRQADCYQLQVGHLPETLDLVQTLIRK